MGGGLGGLFDLVIFSSDDDEEDDNTLRFFDNLFSLLAGMLPAAKPGGYREVVGMLDDDIWPSSSSSMLTFMLKKIFKHERRTRARSKLCGCDQ
jgi:hypothetical protein